jgi:hypothetical protein
MRSIFETRHRRSGRGFLAVRTEVVVKSKMRAPQTPRCTEVVVEFLRRSK